MTFDTLTYAWRLKASGFTDQQAETLAEATRDVVVQDFSANFATKSDIAGLKADIAPLEQRFTALLENQALRLTVRMGIMLAAGLSLVIAILGALIKFH
jgi:hypothetical protein